MRFKFLRDVLPAVVLAAASSPACAYVVGDGVLQGDIYSAGGASGSRTFHPFFEEVFVDPSLIEITQESKLTGSVTPFGSAQKQQLLIYGISLATEIVPSHQSASPSLIALSSTPSHYTFDSLAPGFYYLQVHAQVLLDNDIDYDTPPDWGLGFNVTAFATPVASPAPDAAPLLVTALGLLAVACQARRKTKVEDRGH